MDLIQYAFPLDKNHCMDAIRQRVAAKRHLLDNVPGLRWKAWLISEPLAGTRQAKSYAPLYQFDSMESTLAFLSSDLYRGVTNDFGWTAPFHGLSLGTSLTDAPTSISLARSCTLRTFVLTEHASLLGAAAPVTPPKGALLQARLLDVSRMQLRVYTFWPSPPSGLDHVDVDLVYEVVAVSCPIRNTP
jgi:Domain of unknown function (DUF4865)